MDLLCTRTYIHTYLTHAKYARGKSHILWKENFKKVRVGWEGVREEEGGMRKWINNLGFLRKPD
jgi:hypothetical protein